MDSSTLVGILCFGLPIGLFAIILAIIFGLFRRAHKGMKQITVADDFTFYEDSEGRIHRIGKSFRNTAAYVLFISWAIGSLICAGSSAFKRDWGNAFAGIIMLTIPAGVLWYLWKLRKAPKLIFDTPVKTMILQAGGKEERIHFEHIKRFDVGFRSMRNGEGGTYPNHGHYDVTVLAGNMGHIEVATFSGNIKKTVKKADEFVATLEKITQPPETRAESKAKAAQPPERVIDIDRRLSIGSESHLKLILEQIKNVQNHAEGSFAIFEVDPGKNYYLQILNIGDNWIYAEASTATRKKPKNQLSSSQNQKLVELGWMYPTAGEAGYWRDWQLTNDEDRKRVAELLLVTLIEVYGFQISQVINVKENFA